MAQPQISFTILLQPSVTVEQYLALLNVIQEGASSYAHMIAGITTNNITPELMTLPISVEVTGMADPEARALLKAALDAVVVANPTIQWSFVDVPATG
jgi:hypothetical protein